MITERNSPCPCGSGRKYKKCCLAKDEEEAASRLAEAARASREKERRAKEERQTLAAEREARMLANPVPAEVSDTDIPDSVAFQARCEREFGWPPLPPEDQQLVDAWWAEVLPDYMTSGGLKRPGWLLERVLAFLDQQPRLFRYLCLHDEFLLEVGPALCAVGCSDGFCKLLLRLRDEQPEVYSQCFGYWDLFLLAEALRTNQTADVPACLTLFRQEPIKFIDQFAEVVDLLAWHGCQAELYALLEPTATQIANSPEVLDGSFGLRWLTILAVLPVLEAGDDSPAALEGMLQQVTAVGYLKDGDDNREMLRRAVRMALPTEAETSLDLDQDPGTQFEGDLGWSFTGWLTRTKGLPWISARFLAVAMLDYWYWTIQGKKPAKKGAKKNGLKHLALKPGTLLKYLEASCISFLGVRTVAALPALQAFHYFTEYLVARGYLDAETAVQLQAATEADFELIQKAAGLGDPVYHIYPTFEGLLSGDRLNRVR